MTFITHGYENYNRLVIGIDWSSLPSAVDIIKKVCQAKSSLPMCVSYHFTNEHWKA